jgi:hypothetical protein
VPFWEALLLHYIYTTLCITRCQGRTTNFFWEVRGQCDVIAVLPSLIEFEVNYSDSLRRCTFQNCSANATAGWIGALGLVLSTIPASCGRRSLFVELQRSQAVTTLSQVCCPHEWTRDYMVKR